jgi:hypothetical protein
MPIIFLYKLISINLTRYQVKRKAKKKNEEEANQIKSNERFSFKANQVDCFFHKFPVLCCRLALQFLRMSESDCVRLEF